MKVITPDAGLASYKKIFKEMQDQKQKVVFWQVYQGKRTISETVLVSSNAEAQLMNYLPPDQEFVLSLPVFFYVEDQALIYKAQVEALTQTSLSLKFPLEMKLLDAESEVATFMDYKVKTFWSSTTTSGTERINDYVKVKSMKERSSRDQELLQQEFDYAGLDAEDKLFADKRESPRVRPKADKLVRLVRKGESKLHVMKLFDLSRGGMGFLTFKADDFPKNTEVFVTGFDAFDLDDPLIGTIVAHRPIEGSSEVKIGVKFNDGQE